MKGNSGNESRLWVTYKGPAGECSRQGLFKLFSVNEVNVSTTINIMPLGNMAKWRPAFGTAFETTDVKLTGDDAVRDSYNKQVSAAYQEFIKEAAVFHDAQECFGEDLARKAFETRDTIKKEHQDQTSLTGRITIFFRNIFAYWSSNATYEGLATKKNPEEIAYSAFKTDGSDMGLVGNGFGDVLDTWKAIKTDCDLYPEHITPAMVEAYKAQAPGAVNVAEILAARDRVVTQGTADAVAALVARSAGLPYDKADSRIVDVSEFNEIDAAAIPASNAANPPILSKDELLASLMTHVPRRGLAAYI